MSYIVQIFGTFWEASQFAKHVASRKGIELCVTRTEGRWYVTADTQVEVPNYEELERQVQKKDAEAEDLRRRMIGLEQQFQQIAEEKERFRRRIIEQEAKQQSGVVVLPTRAYEPKPIREAKCEACDRTLSFCRCAG